MKNITPILLFTYKRLHTLKLTIDALKNNFLAKESDLYIFSDGHKSDQDRVEVEKVRNYLNTINGFKSVTIFESDKNKGLANSIIDGVSKIINEHEKVIVLEDDLVTSSNFLDFMNQALEFYKNNEKIFSIAGYTPIIKNNTDDIYFTQRASSWGWATWNDRWEQIDWQVKDYDYFKNNYKLKKKFNKMGSDMNKMLKDQMTGKINSWAIRWCYSQFKQEKYTVYPTLSKIENIGTDSDASHTRDSYNRFHTILDYSLKREFIFYKNIQMNNKYLKQFLQQYSIYNRIKFKILNYF